MCDHHTRGLGGQVKVVEASPDMTIREFKRQLKAMREETADELSKLTSVELLMGEAKLIDDETVMEAGLSSEVVLQVCFAVVMIC